MFTIANMRFHDIASFIKNQNLSFSYNFVAIYNCAYIKDYCAQLLKVLEDQLIKLTGITIPHQLS